MGTEYIFTIFPICRNLKKHSTAITVKQNLLIHFLSPGRRILEFVLLVPFPVYEFLCSLGSEVFSSHELVLSVIVVTEDVKNAIDRSKLYGKTEDLRKFGGILLVFVAMLSFFAGIMMDRPPCIIPKFGYLFLNLCKNLKSH
mmetsp:Transcript_953/g.1879  ORF Transcript_953/g.1879 Transcript_953/m.1879 type:complete len:142 (+) Transcript_953:1735-2160(+)